MHWRKSLLLLCAAFGREITCLPDCTAADISAQQVGNCECGGGHVACNPQTQCPAGPPLLNCFTAVSGVHLNDCSGACGSDQNRPCDSCWLWFNALCTCLKFPGSCLTSKNTPPYWVLLNPSLITSTLLIPDILDLQRHHQTLRDAVWEFGQTVSVPGSQALAINSAHSKTEDQVHMHVCPANSGVKADLTKLSSQCVTCHKTLTQVTVAGTQMWCRADQAKDTAIDNVADDIDNVLGMANICPYFVGAAVVRDSNGYTWSCVTIDHLDTEHHFCY